MVKLLYDGKITLEEADKDQSDLADEINEFFKKTKPRDSENKRRKKNCYKKLA